MKKIILVLFVALFSVAVADAQQPKKGEKKTVTTTFVTDIDCEGCAKKVTNTIPYEKGVKDVQVDVPSKTVTVTYDPAKTNDEALVKAFSKIKIKAEAGCCGDCAPKGEKKEAACCDGHDHGHGHSHDHSHGHNHKH
jgi:copper chaperone CopZ